MTTEEIDYDIISNSIISMPIIVIIFLHIRFYAKEVSVGGNGVKYSLETNKRFAPSAIA